VRGIVHQGSSSLAALAPSHSASEEDDTPPGGVAPGAEEFKALGVLHS